MVKSIYDLGYDWDVLRNKHDIVDISKRTTIHNNSKVSRQALNNVLPVFEK